MVREVSEITKGQIMEDLVHPYSDFSFTLSESESLGSTELRVMTWYIFYFNREFFQPQVEVKLKGKSGGKVSSDRLMAAVHGSLDQRLVVLKFKTHSKRVANRIC